MSRIVGPYRYKITSSLVTVEKKNGEKYTFAVKFEVISDKEGGFVKANPVKRNIPTIKYIRIGSSNAIAS